MSLPKNKRGFRKITVKGIEYNWRFSVTADIRLNSNPKGESLNLNVGLYDIWYHFSDKVKPSEPEVWTVTPKIISEAIIFGRENGWNPEEKNGVFRVIYKDKTFKKEKA